jgi:hypothetical protein
MVCRYRLLSVLIGTSFNCLLPAFECYNGATCDEYNGKCKCPAGFGGDDCLAPSTTPPPPLRRENETNMEPVIPLRMERTATFASRINIHVNAKRAGPGLTATSVKPTQRVGP